MTERRRRVVRVLVAAGGLLALGAALVVGCACSALRAGAVLRDALEPPADLDDVVASRVEVVPTRAGPTEVRIVLPRDSGGPLPAVVLVHGAVDAGARERRLRDFARAFAAHGAVVAVPHLDALAAFRMDADDPGRVADVGAWLASRTDLAEDGRVALAGISVGGSYAILAADDPALRDRTSAVLAFGAYSELEPLLLRWMTASEAGNREMFDPLTEGRRLVLLGQVDRLVPAEHRDAVRAAIEAARRGRPLPPARLPQDVQEIVDVAVSGAPIPEDVARRLLGRLEDVTRALSPGLGAAPGARVHLLHGDRDPVVPVTDLEVLAAALRSRGADVETHRTDLFGHVDAAATPGLVEAWPLLRFFGGFLSDAGL